MHIYISIYMYKYVHMQGVNSLVYVILTIKWHYFREYISVFFQHLNCTIKEWKV